MGTLQVKLFGRVQVSHNNWKTEVSTSRTIQGMLAYLLLQRHRTHSRNELAALFWGEQDEEKARGCLNTTLWRLRRTLKPEGMTQDTYLTSNRFGEVGFNRTSHYWLDVAVFEEQIGKILMTPFDKVDEKKVQKLVSVMQLYRGELLEGFYNDWALRERERLRTFYLNSLAYLMKYEEHHHEYERALVYGQQILEIDPLREEIHREVMRLYVENHQRPLAVRQYLACCATLEAELDINPMPETQALYAQIVFTESSQPANNHEKSPDLQEALHSLQQVAHSVEQVHVQLARVIKSIQSLL